MFALAQENKELSAYFLTALPEKIRSPVEKSGTDRLLEVRLRCGEKLCCVLKSGSYLLSAGGELLKERKNAVSVTERDIKSAIELITGFSLYAYENEMKCGFITISGGHRIGICGEVNTEKGGITHLKSIQSLNYRFAREIVGCADGYMEEIVKNGEIKNTLIVSPPMCGKTTLLRDIARNLSLLGKRVSIIDERGEIAAQRGGISPFDLGLGCDILSGAPKAEGMLYMLRSMSPDVIITDEIGGNADLYAIREIKKRGVSVIASIHGRTPSLSDFDTYISLERSFLDD